MNDFPDDHDKLRSTSPQWMRLVFVSCGLAIAAIALSGYDAGLRYVVNTHKLPGDLRRFLELMEVFGHGTGLAITIALIWSLAPQFRRRLPQLISAYVLSGLIVNLIKLGVPRLRPLAGMDVVASELPGLNLEHVSQSFPSGHSAAAVALAVGLSCLFPRGKVVFGVLALLACLQRIVFDAHWLSDVLAGSAIGIFVSATVFLLPQVDNLFLKFRLPKHATSKSRNRES